ncbi:MAG: hypothetical protein KIPDCIKN_00103 [Haliscomenobacter sp.]|jgi:hypothetical protein|nr:hypothetical protein [Haliscomenobacter sp.]
MRIVSLLTLMLLLQTAAVWGQPSNRENLMIYLDCGQCDVNFIKQEIPQVNYTLDPLRAQVHVLVSVQWLDSGGRIYLFEFIGREKFEGDRFSLEILIDPQNTSLERSEKIVNALKAGLVVFVAQNGESDRVQVTLPALKPVVPSGVESTTEGDLEDEELPGGFFNQWIYEVFSNLDWNKETNRSTLNMRYGGNMNYITDQWRIRLNSNFNYTEGFVQDDEEKIEFSRRNNGISSALIKSITSHWSAGVFFSWNQSTYTNIQNSYWLTPAIEYSIFPYSEAVTKEFTIAYRLGMTDQHYLEETIFLKTREKLLRQSIELQLDMRQRWGNVDVQISAANFFQDWRKNRLTMEADVSFRVIKGLSFSVGGNYILINDQINLRRGDATLEEILLGQRQLATDFESGLNFGMRYTFGALYNNVVNTRL